MRATRKRLGLTQTELGNRLGVSLRTIQQVETADFVPKLYSLALEALAPTPVRFDAEGRVGFVLGKGCVPGWRGLHLRA